ncbi:MAG: pyruvate-flavodoxin oxidoreductase [gamma proteobacterium endosymbiont of Lamellibrachia anaximandri]|nr:pyruvate-flavodoxin oxidoreductase [gamma proteobacterium endosymbiont of Lamellibrachia anaximandri]MBL3534984.1 pyruvate-flavodoxin oxidoreductase [gamma proteobacterium endosymbiont of Lamellibrachia anaximandri]
MNLIFVLGGLLIAALMLASIVHRYQAHMAQKRMKIQRLLRGVDLVEDLLDRLSGCPLPAETRQLLQKDMLARYQAIRGVDRRYEGIDRLIGEIGQTLASAEVASQSHKILDKPHLQKVVDAFGELMGFLQEGGLLNRTPAEVVREHVEQLAMQRAECVSRFHFAKAEQLFEEGNVRDALGHCNAIKEFLTEKGPNSDEARMLYDEAEALRKRISEHEADN